MKKVQGCTSIYIGLQRKVRNRETDCSWKLHASVPKGRRRHRFALKYTEVDDIVLFSSILMTRQFIPVVELWKGEIIHKLLLVLLLVTFWINFAMTLPTSLVNYAKISIENSTSPFPTNV